MLKCNSMVVVGGQRLREGVGAGVEVWGWLEGGSGVLLSRMAIFIDSWFNDSHLHSLFFLHGSTFFCEAAVCVVWRYYFWWDSTLFICAVAFGSVWRPFALHAGTFLLLQGSIFICSYSSLPFCIVMHYFKIVLFLQHFGWCCSLLFCTTMLFLNVWQQWFWWRGILFCNSLPCIPVDFHLAMQYCRLKQPHKGRKTFGIWLVGNLLYIHVLFYPTIQHCRSKKFHLVED